MQGLRKLKDEGGQALTEFAVVMPLLFIILFAIVEGGITVNNYLRLTDAVRSAARAASISSTQTAAASAATTALSNAAGGLTVKLDSVLPADGTWSSGHPVYVQAETKYAITLPLFGTVLSGTITSHSTQRIE